MTFQTDLFAGRTALVSGGTQGIGAGVATELARLGATVIAAGLAPAAGAEAPQGARIAELDVTDQASVDRLVGGLGRLDILVNCAGVIRRVEEHDPAVFAQVLAVNLTGTMR